MIIIVIEDGCFQGAWSSKAEADTNILLLDMDAVESGDDGIGCYNLGDASDMDEEHKEILNEDSWFVELNGGEL